MKNKYNKKKYKMQSGVQQIQMDTPDYSEAYRIRSEANAKQQMGSGLARTGLDIAGTAIGIPGLGGIAEGVGSLSESLLTDAKGNYKNKFAESASLYLNPLKTAGTALSALTGDKAAAAELWNKIPVTQLLSGIGIKNPFGKTTQEKVKEEAKKEEERKERSNRIANYYGGYKQEASTNAQAALAKRGKYKVKSKYKVKTKEPRLIETEGREPIFSPKKKDGSRDLLYYNPNDPTHEEGGVKAVVMPKAQAGRKEVKIPMNVADLENTKRMSSSKAAANRQRQEDSKSENFIELFEPSGTLSYDDVMRSYDRTGLSRETALEAVGALPFIKYMKLLKGPKTAYKEYMLSKALRWAGKGAAADQAKDMASEELANIKKANGASNLMPKRSKVSLLGSGNMAVGARQIKVNELNNTSLSQNLGGMPAVNAANKFVQPMASKMQVARQIPEYRRKATIKNPMSHKKENPDTNKIVDPPTPIELKAPITPSGFNKKTLYEAKLPKPVSTHNTKNDFNKGSKRVKVYR